MMQLNKQLLQSIVMGLALPAVLVTAVIWRGREPVDAVTPPTSDPPATTAGKEQTIRIPVLSDGVTTEMELEEYLLGVLLAEMPPDFETEALKAQAVAARTFTLWNCTQYSNHEPAAVCTEATCCQGYLAPTRYISQGGTNSHLERLRTVLADTAGQVVYYGDGLILATYFSCSGGITEDALSVWGQSYPYLQSVESPGEEDAACFADEKHFSRSEFESALGIELSGLPGTWFGVITYTQGGGVDSADICGTTFRGTELRKTLGLRSTVLSFSVSEDGITVQTRGYGHRVGLSQYGADAMALSGHDYRAILRHYYPGTHIEVYRSK